MRIWFFYLDEPHFVLDQDNRSASIEWELEICVVALYWKEDFKHVLNPYLWFSKVRMKVNR